MLPAATSVGVDIWHIDTRQMNIDYQRCLHVLDQTERDAAAKFKHQSLSERYVLNHGLVRIILADYLAAQPCELQFEREVYGKPYLPDYPELTFNISHSADDLLLAVSSGVSLGVDIERIRPRQNFSGVIERCCSVNEQFYWKALPEEFQIAAFYKFWTYKEAFVKAVGRGLALGLNQIEFDLERGAVMNVPQNCGMFDEWWVGELAVGSWNSAALVIRGMNPELKLRSIAEIKNL